MQKPKITMQPDTANLNPGSVDSFINLHKKKRSPWLLVSMFMFVGFLGTLAYAYKSSGEYSPLIVAGASTNNLTYISAESDTNAKSSQTSPSTVTNTTLYFKKDKNVYKRSPLGNSPEVVLTADIFTVSQDGSRIAYFQKIGEGEGDVFTMQDTTNQKTENITLDEYDGLRKLDFSPTGEYLLANFGTGPNGKTKVIDATTSQVVGEFGQIGDIHWSDSYHFLHATPEKGVFARPWGSGQGSSIEIVDIRNLHKIQILKATDLVDYYPTHIFPNCVLVSKKHVVRTADWADIENQKIIEETICVDPDTHMLSENIYQSEIIEGNAAISEIFAYMRLDKSAGDTIVWSRVNKKGDWIAFEVRRARSPLDGDIYLADIKNVEDSLMLMGQGSGVYWVK